MPMTRLAAISFAAIAALARSRSLPTTYLSSIRPLRP